ncbi:MAG TPA: tetratricopeptide repeat protein [Candidatus Polarisedimenticolia bacterium]|nr:tetratricopeptide repeat protein [Candidatus Polarisedimenticolia bacterium]
MSVAAAAGDVPGAGAGGGVGRGRFLLAAGLLLASSIGVRAEFGAAGRGTATAPLLYLPSGRYLQIASLGFDALLADALYLWSIQYYSNYDIADRYDYLEHIYKDVITELDPRYLDPYLIGSMIMTAEAQQPEMALRLLDKGIEKNPDQWILPFEAGFTCYQTLKDYTRAARYFDLALTIPGVPPIVQRFKAEMTRRAGDIRDSLQEWAAIHEAATDEYVRTIAWNHVHDLRVQVDLEDLQGAIALYQSRTGRLPAGLAALAAAGIVPATPRDPEGHPYLYDPRTGVPSYGGLSILGR